MRIAIYAGSFDPITRGHLSVIERGARLFDRLYVLIAVNPAKRALFSMEERLRMIRDATLPWPNVECARTGGLVVDFARDQRARYLVRGVRGCTDAEAEIALADLNRKLAPDIETVFVPAHPGLSEVSSSRLKQLAAGGADLSRYCTPAVAACLKAAMEERAAT